MKRSFYGLLGSGFASLLCAAAVSAAEPVPSLDFDFSSVRDGIVKDSAKSGLGIKVGSAVKDGALVLNPKDTFAAVDEAAFKAWAKKADTREIAACVWIRFDRGGIFAKNAVPDQDSPVASLGLFDCCLDEQGRITVRVFTKKTEMQLPVLMNSTFKAEYGKWYHVEFSYSMNERRCKLYIDGKYQMENDNAIIPCPGLGDLKLGNGFRGAIRDLKFYEMALDSEELAISDATAADYEAVKQTAMAAAMNTRNAALKSWIREICGTDDKYKANAGKVTIAAFKRLKTSAENARTLADGMSADEKGTVSDQVVTAYVTPATTQALYLPTVIPENGKLSNKVELVMSQNELESASLVVFPFKRIKSFTIKSSDLRSGNNVIKADDVDIKLVKRWYRAGGAWLTYHVDKYMRVLTPDMLLNDDKLFKVDEFRKTNYMLLHYPGGDRYQDVSEYRYENEWLDGCLNTFFYDAPTFQPMELPEAGRNQQFIITYRTKKNTAPGMYRGTLTFMADGKTAGTLSVKIRVLPFELPFAKTYYDTSKDYISHVNSHNGNFNVLKLARDHNLFHVTGVASDADGILQCKSIDYPLDIVFSWPDCGMPEFGGPADKITPELKERMECMAVAPVLRYEKMFEKYSGLKDYTIFRVWTSEAAWYGAIALGPDEIARVLRERTHLRLFSHGMTEDVPDFSPGIYEMDSSTNVTPKYSRIWHAVGGRNITYASPFPSPENPGLMRRVMGLELYKANLYDGHMMHGFIANQFDEFTKYPGGDGDYRSFQLAYTCKNGAIPTLAIVGVREGYEDVRWATLMKTQAEKAMQSKDQLIAQEAKRQLAWLERVDGDKMDMDDFRANVQFRIVTLQNLIKARGGK